MASASTSASACIVSMITRGPSSMRAMARVASTPSISGIDTSMRTTSGRSSPARRTASSPFSASPTTSKPSSIIERRSPSRSMRWSSASRSRMVTPPPGGSRRSRAGDDAAYPRAAPRPGPHVEGGADAGGSLPHPDDAVGVEPPGVAGREPDAVVGHLERGSPAVAAPGDREVGGLGVALHVGDGLLGDPPHLPLLEDGEPSRLLGAQADVEARALPHALEEPLEDHGQALRLAHVGAEV